VLVAVVLAMLVAMLSSAQSVSTTCEVANCELCPVTNLAFCITCSDGFLLKANGSCRSTTNGDRGAETVMLSAAVMVAAAVAEYLF